MSFLSGDQVKCQASQGNHRGYVDEGGGGCYGLFDGRGY